MQRSIATAGTLDAATIWTGRPGGGIRFQRGDVFLVPFSLLFFGFAVFCEAAIAGSGQATPFFLAFGGAFMLLALYLLAGRFIYDMYVRSLTTYGLTNDSALIDVGGVFPRRSTIYLPSMNKLNLVQAKDGTGSIYFGDPPDVLSGTRWTSINQKAAPGFLYIDNAADVYELCKKAQQSRTS